MADLDVVVHVVTKGTDKLKGIGSGLADVGKVAAVGLGVAAAGAVALGAAFIDAAQKSEAAQAKVQNTFDQMGASAFTSIEALDAHAEALAKATIFDDEGVKEAQATLLTFGNIGAESFERATEAAADMSAFFGSDLQSSSVQLGKALNDPVAGITALSRVGVSFTEEQQALIKGFVDAGDAASAQAIILAELEKQVGGTATALAETSGGVLAQAMEDLGEAGETIGTLLLPVLATVASAIAGLAAFVQEHMPQIQAVISTVLGFIGGIFAGAGGKVNGLTAIFQGLVAWVKQNLPTIMSVAGQVFGAVGNAVKVVAPVLIELAKIILPAIGVAASLLFKALDIAFKGIGGAFEVLGTVFETVAGTIEDVVGGVVGAFKGIYNAFARFWNSIQLTFPSLDIPFFGKIGGFTLGLPDIPELAAGGIVSQPTLALIGEKGPEAVVPLDKMTGNQTVIEVTVLGDLKAEDEKSLADAIGRVWWASGFSDQVLTNG